MIVEIPLIIRPNPLMNPYGKPEEEENPPIHIGALWLSKGLFAPDLEGFDFINFPSIHIEDNNQFLFGVNIKLEPLAGVAPTTNPTDGYLNVIFATHSSVHVSDF